MSTSEFTLRLNEMRQQKMLRRITQSLLPVIAYANLAAKYRRALEAAREKLHVLREINIELMMSDAKHCASYLIVLVAALAVYGIDFILLSAVAEYFARKVYSEPFMVTIARLIVPAAILIIEIMIASQRAFSREREAEHGGGKKSWVWVIFSLLLLCVLPSMLVATHIVTMPARMTQSLEVVSVLQVVGLVTLAVVMHGVILYGGQLAVEAKAYLYLSYRSWRLDRSIRRLDDKYEKAASSATEAYILHERSVQEFRTMFPDADIASGPFDLTTRGLLQARLGHELPVLPTLSDTGLREGQNSLQSDG